MTEQLYFTYFNESLGFPGSLAGKKNLPVVQETPVRFLCQEDPLEEGMATHFCFLAW